MLSSVVLTRNEEKNIKGCLESLRFCDEIIVIDDFSSDSTIKIAKTFKAQVYQKKLENDFSALRNFGLEKANGDWVLFVDADEKVSRDLAEEITAKISDQRLKSNGFYCKRKDKFLGKWLKWGETNSVNLLRLARKGSGKWQGKVHEEWKVKGKAGYLKKALIHQRNLTVAQLLQKINQYSTIRAGELYKQGVKTNMFLVFAYPAGKFLDNYFIKLGFLDGVPGLIMAGMMSLHSFQVRAKLWVELKNQGREEFIVPWQKYAK